MELCLEIEPALSPVRDEMFVVKGRKSRQPRRGDMCVDEWNNEKRRRDAEPEVRSKMQERKNRGKKAEGNNGKMSRSIILYESAGSRRAGE